MSHTIKNSPSGLTTIQEYASIPMDTLIRSISMLLKNHLEAHKVCRSHDIHHALRVLTHVQRAIHSTDLPLTRPQILALSLAALLHDADDHKFFPVSKMRWQSSSAPRESRVAPTGRHLRWQHATTIMNMSGILSHVQDLAIQMIAMVSTTENANDVPKDCEPWMLWPRHADRLEATGWSGIVRCYEYTQTCGNPLFLPTTERATDPSSLDAIASEKRFQDYVSSGGKSKSMMDHYYDKLLRLSTPIIWCENIYLRNEARRRYIILEKFCLEFGKTGTIPESFWDRAQKNAASEMTESVEWK